VVTNYVNIRVPTWVFTSLALIGVLFLLKGCFALETYVDRKHHGIYGFDGGASCQIAEGVRFKGCQWADENQPSIGEDCPLGGQLRQGCLAWLDDNRRANSGIE